MVRKFSVNYRAGGYPLPTYSGQHMIVINAGERERLSEVKARALLKAKREIAHSMAMEVTQVKIVDFQEVD